MPWDLLFDPLFRLPFFTGLVFAVVLPVLGLYLRMREEWLAALGFAHLGGAGGVVGSLMGLPPVLAALGVAGGGVAARGLVRRTGNDLYAVMILGGWAAMILGSQFGHHARTLAQTLVDGQLYFTGIEQLVTALVFAVVFATVMPWLSPHLLRARLFPGQDRANGRPVAMLGFGFNILVAAAVALASMAMGVMASFALIFIAPWVAFALAPGWRVALLLTMLIGIAAYLVAFVMALVGDLPFGPTLVAIVVVLAILRLLPRWR
ncbi:metal ABC transporter permease [Aquisalimonas sp.]|uniref:metal ABC transporter permease n=1 Tax=Aquisalimonas sp. TaxID=1872621 RepID=UPI0025BF66F9|nr:metal ABC transporter permease [Aquisalimonas sp.]